MGYGYVNVGEKKREAGDEKGENGVKEREKDCCVRAAQYVFNHCPSYCKGDLSCPQNSPISKLRLTILVTSNLIFYV